MEGSLLGISVLAVVLLVIMPVLLYLMGWAVTRYTKEPPSWIGFPAEPEEPSDEPPSSVET
jgi:hypothetical protein